MSKNGIIPETAMGCGKVSATIRNTNAQQECRAPCYTHTKNTELSEQCKGKVFSCEGVLIQVNDDGSDQ